MTSFRAAIRTWEEPVRPISILEFLQRPARPVHTYYVRRMQFLQRLQSMQRVQYARCVQTSEFPDNFVL